MDRPRMGRGRHVRGPQLEQHRRNDTREVRAEKGRRMFSFSWGKIGRGFPYLLGGDGSRSAAIEVLGRGLRRENSACADCGTEREIQLVEGCGLRPRTQLIQLIYLRYLCGSAEREKRMDVCFLLTLYI